MLNISNTNELATEVNLLGVKIDQQQSQMATKIDLQHVVDERNQKFEAIDHRLTTVEAKADMHDEFIHDFTNREQIAAKGFVARFKAKGVDYAISAIITVIAFLFIWGMIQVYTKATDETPKVELERLN